LLQCGHLEIQKNWWIFGVLLGLNEQLGSAVAEESNEKMGEINQLVAIRIIAL